MNMNVRNMGPHYCGEVAQVYMSDVESSLPTPVKKLYRLRKITLEPGEVQTVSFAILVSELSFYTEVQKTVEGGIFMVTIGDLSTGFAVRK